MEILVPVLSVLARVLIGFSLAFAGAAGLGLAGRRTGFRAHLGRCVPGHRSFGAAAGRQTRRFRRELQPRDGFLLVSLVWLVLPAFARAAADADHARHRVVHRAYFEAMTALTATGATALSGLDTLPLSVNVWRCFLQLGRRAGHHRAGVAVLPLLGVGGMQLYKAETPGPMKDTKLTPRIAETARGLWTVYFVLSAACLLAYRCGRHELGRCLHAHVHHHGPGRLLVARCQFRPLEFAADRSGRYRVHALSGISFALVLRGLARSRSTMPLLRDAEVRAYAAVLVAATAAVCLVLIGHGTYDSYPQALRATAFQVVSLATTTGYASTDYALWPVFAPVLLIFLGCFASCAGSTGGGIKMVRMILLLKQARRELVRIIHPRVVNPVTLGGVTVPSSVIATILGFMLIYGASIVGFTMLLLLSGLDLITAFSAVIVCVNNIGPGLGQVGPAANFGFLSAFQLWVCTAAMLLGRLELLTVLVLFTRPVLAQMNDGAATACPCGRLDARRKPLPFLQCCGRYLTGGEPAPDAPSLMRSRYTAFVRGDEAYLLATWHPSTRPSETKSEPGTKWLGLEVRDHREIDATHAQVEFVARCRPAPGSGPAVRLHERSRFVREGARWYYVDGDSG